METLSRNQETNILLYKKENGAIKLKFQQYQKPW